MYRAQEESRILISKIRILGYCEKLTQLVLYVKAEMVTMHNAMTRAGISFDKSPHEQKPTEQANGEQKGKFAGTAKEKIRTKRSLAHYQQRDEVSDSDDEPSPNMDIL